MSYQAVLVLDNREEEYMSLLMKKATTLLLALGLLLGPVNVVLARDYQVYAVAAQEVVTSISEVHAKYGNATLAVTGEELETAGYKVGDILTLEVNGKSLEAPLCTEYSDVDQGSLVVRSKGNVVIFAINLGNIATTYSLSAGDAVKINLKEAAGYLDEYEIRRLERTNNRDDYASDEIFANFRPILTSGIEPGVLYRSSSPINNEIKRAAYADKLISPVDVY